MSLMQATMGTVPIATLSFASTLNQAVTVSATKTVSTSIGTASEDRWVIVLIQYGPASATTRTISSATINGVTATIAYDIGSTTTTQGAGAVYAKVPTGTGVVTITVTLSGTRTSTVARFFVYTITGRTNLSYASGSDSTAASVTSRSTTLACSVSGFLLHHWGGSSAPTAGSWSGTDSTLQNASSDSINQVSAYDGTNANGGIAATTTYSQTNLQTCRLLSSSWIYI